MLYVEGKTCVVQAMLSHLLLLLFLLAVLAVLLVLLLVLLLLLHSCHLLQLTMPASKPEQAMIKIERLRSHSGSSSSQQLVRKQ